jgi:peptidoglycan/xylan/chitin deacetylase (PgdA/CDA1 family)
MCAPCTLHLDHHYFCSAACHAKWADEQAPKRQSKKAKARARKAARLAEKAAERAKDEAERLPPPAPAGALPLPAHSSTELRSAGPEGGQDEVVHEGSPPGDGGEEVPLELTDEAHDPFDDTDDSAEYTAADLAAHHAEAFGEAAPAPAEATADAEQAPAFAADAFAAAAAVAEAPPPEPAPEPTAAPTAAAADAAPRAAPARTPIESRPYERTPPAPIILHQAAPAPMSRAWLVALTVANLAALALALYAVYRPAPPPAAGGREIAELNRLLRSAVAPPPAPEIDAAPVETTAATLVVTGDARGAARVRLYFNGKEAAPPVIAAGRFRSVPLPLDYGLNVVQAAGEGAGGTAHFSLAVLVRRRDVPPAVAHAVRIELPTARDTERGNPARKAVSFTFDGGSDANAAAEILTVLKANHVRTTLFLTGEFIRRFPDVARRAVADGHEIGNHTYSHPHLTTYELNGKTELREGVDEAYVVKQLTAAAAAFERATGRKMAPLWRAPYGEENAQIRAWAERAGYRHIGWTRHVGPLASLDSLDWVEDKESRLYVTGAELKRRFVQVASAEPDALRGGIFLMHLGTDRKTDRLHWQLDEILKTYLRLGFEIVPVSELIR